MHLKPVEQWYGPRWQLSVTTKCLKLFEMQALGHPHNIYIRNPGLEISSKAYDREKWLLDTDHIKLSWSSFPVVIINISM